MAKATLSWSGQELRLESHEGAANVIHLEGPPPALLEHLSLHRVDLEFAQACLTVIEATPREHWHTPAIEAAWRSALLHYCKCFAPPEGGVGRSQLSVTKILGREAGQHGATTCRLPITGGCQAFPRKASLTTARP